MFGFGYIKLATTSFAPVGDSTILQSIATSPDCILRPDAAADPDATITMAPVSIAIDPPGGSTSILRLHLALEAEGDRQSLFAGPAVARSVHKDPLGNSAIDMSRLVSPGRMICEKDAAMTSTVNSPEM